MRPCPFPGLCSSGCSRRQGDSTPYKAVLGWPTDLDSPLSILTPTASAAKLHVAQMTSPAHERGNQSISQSGRRPRGRHPSEACLRRLIQSQPMVVQTGNLSLRVETYANVSSVPEWDSNLASSSGLILGKVPPVPTYHQSYSFMLRSGVFKISFRGAGF